MAQNGEVFNSNYRHTFLDLGPACPTSADCNRVQAESVFAISIMAENAKWYFSIAIALAAAASVDFLRGWPMFAVRLAVNTLAHR